MDGFTKRTQEKMENIELATISLFQLAPNEIKITDIANKAKVSQVSIYNYYGSKEKLLQSSAKRLINQQIQLFEAIIAEQELSFKDKLERIIDYKKQNAKILDGLSKHVQLFQDYYGTLSARTVPLFIKFIQMGRGSGYIRNTVTDETLLYYLDIIGEVISRIDHFPSNYEKKIEGIMDMFLYGILNQE